MNLLALLLLPSVIQPLPAVMPFHDVNRRESEQTKVWQMAINKFKSNNRWREIRDVNEYWNGYQYGLTPAKWQTPEDLFESQRGDCKDIAIAKYYSLRYLGVAASRLKLTVVLDDSNRWHAVLVVDDRVLDNQTLRIKELDDVSYQPAYSVNENNLWTITPVQ